MGYLTPGPAAAENTRLLVTLFIAAVVVAGGAIALIVIITGGSSLGGIGTIQAVPKGRDVAAQAALGGWDEARQQRCRRPTAGGPPPGAVIWRCCGCRPGWGCARGGRRAGTR